MSQRYMLDTNVLSHIMQGRDAIAGAPDPTARGASGDLQRDIGGTGVRACTAKGSQRDWETP